jgi:uncharacterized protein YkwD
MDRARIGRLGHVGGWLGSLATLTLAAACGGSDADPTIAGGGQGGSAGPGASGGAAGTAGSAQAGNGGAAPGAGGASSGGASSGGASSGGASSGGATTTSGGASSGTGGAVAGSGGAGTGGRGNSGGRSGSGGAASGGAAGSKATGGAAGTPASVADEYVAAHNAVRAAVTEPANYTGTWAPLPPVTWNETVAATAQAWAEHLRDTQNCGLVHDTASGYGENLAAGSGKMTPTTAVNLWAAEKANYTYSPKYAFMSNTGHYTQIVWRTSVEIGCGSATCGNTTVICCRYSPPGNYIGKAPY